MSKFVGRRGAVGLAKESSAGTPVAPALWLPYTSINFDARTETVREEESLARIEDTDASHITQKFGEGEIEGELEDTRLGLILTSLIGASPVTTGGNPYTHTYTLSNTNTHQSLSIGYQDPDGTQVFPYAVVDNLNINVSQNAVVAYTAGFKSRVGRDWSTLTPSFTSLGSKFLHQHLIFKLAATTGDLAAASAITLKSLELNISANADFDFGLGTVEPEAILNHQFSVEGSITLNKQDSVYKNYMLDGTYRAMEITLSRNSSSSQLQLQFPRVSFTEWEQNRDLDDIVGQTIQFKGHYDAANGVAVISTAVLKNTNAGSSY